MPTKANAKISDVKHIHICGGKNLYCAHPRHGGLWNFGNGELALIHPHASWPYKEKLPQCHSAIHVDRHCILLYNVGT